MNLRQIEVLRAVMRSGSIAGAAQSLHVSSPAVSRLLSYLELKLGIALFDRHKGRLQPTAAARALHAEIERAFGGIDRVRALAEALRHGAGQTLRIGSNLSTALELVPAALAASASAAARRQLQLSLDIVSQSEMTAALLEGTIDLGVGAFLDLQHPQLELHAVGQGQILVAMHQGHALAQQRAVTAAQLAAQPQVLFAPGSTHERQLALLLHPDAPPPQGRLEVRHAILACGMAAQGLGLAIVDDLAAGSAAALPLVLRPLRPALSYRVFAVTRRGHTPAPAVQSLISALRSQWKRLPARARALERSASKAP